MAMTPLGAAADTPADSPVAFMVEMAHASVERVAPERAVELAPLLTGVNFVATDEPAFLFCLRSSTQIEIPIRGVELVWAMSFALWEEVDAHVRAAVSRAGPLPNRFRPETVALLDWALKNQDPKHARATWPSGLPRPTGFEAYAGLPSVARLADDVAMCAVAWILHHEIAHLTQAHSHVAAQLLSLEQERQADEAATKWILDQCPRRLDPRLERAVGVVAAIVCLTALELAYPATDWARNDHPHAPDRLFRQFELPVLDDAVGDFAALAATIGLHFLAERAGVSIPAYDANSGHEALRHYCHVIYEHMKQKE